jgi:hypothetical protein
MNAGKRTTVLLHREIMKAESGCHLDHLNQNKLDNRKSNLRFCSPSQNNMNKGLQKNNQSKYRGVSWDNEAAKWLVTIAIDKKQKKLGRFKSVEDAAYVYNQAARELFGDFAVLNILPTGFRFDPERLKKEKLNWIPSDNTTGIKGVVWHKSRKKWQAQIQINKKHMFLGRFDSFEDAIKARKEAESKML